MNKLSNVELKKHMNRGLDHVIAQIGTFHALTMQTIIHCGQLIIAAKKKFGSDLVVTRLKREHKMPHSMIIGAVKAAQGKLDPRLALLTGKAYYRLSKYDISVQKSVLNSGVKLLVDDPDGKELFVNVDIADLTLEQVDQVMDYNGIRDKEKQRSWLDARKRRAKAQASAKTIPTKEGAKSKTPFTIKNGILTVNKAGQELDTERLLKLTLRTAESAGCTDSLISLLKVAQTMVQEREDA